MVKKRGKQDWVEAWKSVLLPVQYVRLVEQFLFEDRHGMANAGHEAFRRQVYAGKMLDEFTREVMQYKGDDKDFRSIVLTPVLQRQLRGIPDCYYPLIAHTLTESRTEHIPTIGDATTFYLGVDPIDPACIATHRRNLVYIREARWHIACRMGLANVNSIATFDWFLENHDTVMENISPRVPNEFPKFNQTEVEALYIEGLHPLFKTELNRVVCIHDHSCQTRVIPDWPTSQPQHVAAVLKLLPDLQGATEQEPASGSTHKRKLSGGTANTTSVGGAKRQRTTEKEGSEGGNSSDKDAEGEQTRGDDLIVPDSEEQQLSGSEFQVPGPSRLRKGKGRAGADDEHEEEHEEEEDLGGRIRSGGGGQNESEEEINGGTRKEGNEDKGGGGDKIPSGDETRGGDEMVG